MKTYLLPPRVSIRRSSYPNFFSIQSLVSAWRQENQETPSILSPVANHPEFKIEDSQGQSGRQLCYFAKSRLASEARSRILFVNFDHLDTKLTENSVVLWRIMDGRNQVFPTGKNERRPLGGVEECVLKRTLELDKNTSSTVYIVIIAYHFLILEATCMRVAITERLSRAACSKTRRSSSGDFPSHNTAPGRQWCYSVM